MASKQRSGGAWTAQEIRDHEEAARRLTALMHDTFAFLAAHRSATEWQTKEFVLLEMKKRGLIMDAPFNVPIVAFNAHAADPHYRPRRGGPRLEAGTLVMLDVWARLRGERGGRHMPYADITWMGFCGSGASGGARNSGAAVPREMQLVFDTVVAARDACLAALRKAARRGTLPTGRAADETARAVIRHAGWEKEFIHSTGHTLGFVSPHGRGRHLNRKNQRPLLRGLPYTIEPGIYIKGKFGVRSEMNFYVDAAGTVKVTTPLQRKLVIY